MSVPAASMRRVDAQRATPVFPVQPEDVPEDAVRAVKRTLLRNTGDAFDDYQARVIVAVVIAALAEQPPGDLPAIL